MASIEKCIIGELWTDTKNTHFSCLQRGDFRECEAIAAFDILSRYPGIRNDLVGMKTMLEGEKYGDIPGVMAYLLEAGSDVVSIALLPQHIVQLQEIRLKGNILNIIHKADGNLTQKDIDALHKLTERKTNAQEKIIDLKTLCLGYTKVLEKRIDIYKNGMPYPTGFTTLDGYTGGIMEHEIFVVGGRTSLGKSAMLINIACNLAEKNVPILFFSCEMSEVDILDRIVSQKSGVESYKIKFGKVNQDEIVNINAMMGHNDFYLKPFSFCYSPNLTVSDMRTAIEAVKPKIIFLDHIQLLKLQGQNEAQEMSRAMYDLKRLAGEYNIGIVCASQLNRGEEVNKSNLTSNNFKGSGGIEEAAAVACKIKMADETQKEMPEWDIDFEVTKNRHGQIGRVRMKFIRKLLKFVEE